MPPSSAPGTITCPRCGNTQDGGAECRRCGVIFAKARKRPEPAPEEQLPPTGPVTYERTPMFDPDAQENGGGRRVGGVAVVVLLVLLGGARTCYRSFQRRQRNQTEQAQPLAVPDPAAAHGERAAAEAAAIEFAINYDTLQGELGAPLQAVPFDTKVSASGDVTTASLRLDVSGRTGAVARASLELALEDGAWRVTSFNRSRPLSPSRAHGGSSSSAPSFEGGIEMRSPTAKPDERYRRRRELQQEMYKAAQSPPP